MKHLFFILLFMVFVVGFSQDGKLAQQYMDHGNYEKAVLYYEKLYEKYPLNTSHLFSLIYCYQQLEEYEKAEKALLSSIENSRINTPLLYIELGYNYMLKGKEKEAEKNYKAALDAIDENASYAYAIGNAFKKKSILDYAVKSFKKGMELNPDLNFNYDLAYIYGELGDMEGMYSTYLDLIAHQDSYLGNVQRNIGRFISDQSSSENNQLLRKLLLKRTQTDPNIAWNQFLSWLFIQQKQYENAFTQEKAIFKRADEPSLERIVDLGLIAMEDNDVETALKIFNYIIETTNNPELVIQSHLYIIDIELGEKTTNKMNEVEEKFSSLLNEFGYSTETINLQIAYANFLAFHKDENNKAENLLKKILNEPLNRYDEANVKMALGDILVYSEKFNQALIYYSQIQKLLKNDVIAQTARFKVAQTSFYKGDFEWAENQLKVLKASTSQLIANDALELKLLISDNSLEDSTQTALKIYARADLLSYQKKTDEAIELLNQILVNHKGESIEDEALLKQAELLEKKKKYDEARLNYIKIIEFFGTGILADDAIFNLAELYNDILNDPDKAKELYEKIIFNHPDSIYFVEARKKYRMLRGDAIN